MSWIPTHQPPTADNGVIQIEIIGRFVFMITVEVSWRGKRTFQAAVTDMSTDITHATETHRLGLAKRAYREYQRIYR